MADFRRLAVAGHENVTQSSVEYAEKMRANSYVDRFSYLLYFAYAQYRCADFCSCSYCLQRKSLTEKIYAPF